MQPYRIFVDAAADIDDAVREKYGIGVVPMPYLMDGEKRIATGDETEEYKNAYYDSQRKGSVAKTSQPSPKTYMEVFGPVLKAGEGVIYLALSSGLSGTYNSSVVAAENLRELYPGAKIACVDTLSASAGQAILAEEAAIRREEGMGFDENVAWIEADKNLLQHWFMVEDLMYLKRGGRINAATALLGTALSIRPVMRVRPDGTLEQFEKRRGSKAGMRRMVEHFAASNGQGRSHRVYVVHCDNPAGAQFLVDAIKREDPDAQVSVRNMLPFIGAHVGPGLLAVFNWGTEEYRRVQPA